MNRNKDKTALPSAQQARLVMLRLGQEGDRLHHCIVVCIQSLLFATSATALLVSVR